jgi:hypothetical protein
MKKRESNPGFALRVFDLSGQEGYFGGAGNLTRIRVIEAHEGAVVFLDKVLDRIDAPVLYKEGCAKIEPRIVRKKLSMLISWTNKEHSTKRQPGTGMRGMCSSVGLGLLPVNTFGGRLGQRQATAIDSRYIRQ